MGIAGIGAAIVRWFAHEVIFGRNVGKTPADRPVTEGSISMPTTRKTSAPRKKTTPKTAAARKQTSPRKKATSRKKAASRKKTTPRKASAAKKTVRK
jgi:hypothetical protein